MVKTMFYMGLVLMLRAVGRLLFWVGTVLASPQLLKYLWELFPKMEARLLWMEKIFLPRTLKLVICQRKEVCTKRLKF